MNALQKIALFSRVNIFLSFALLLLCGIFISFFITSIYGPLVFIAVGIVSVIISKRIHLTYMFIAITVFSSGWFISSVRLHEIEYKTQTADRIHQKQYSFQAAVMTAGETEKGWKATCRLLTIDSADIKTKLLGIVYGHGRIPAMGDTVFSKGKFVKLSDRRNPGEFNFKAYYARQNIYCRIFIDKKDSPRIISGGQTIISDRIIHSVQNYIRQTIQNSTDQKTAGLLLALLLGDKSSIDENLKADFADTGVIHVLAVSGLHVGYILIILTICASILRIPWGWNRLVIILGLFFYAALTGGKPSVIRASFMAVLYVLAPVLDRQPQIWNIIGFSAAVLLAYDPMYIQDLGFILSFSAVISIVFFYSLLTEKVLPEFLNPRSISNPILSNGWSLFLVSLSAQLGTLPITALFFHKIPVISLVANVLIVPIVGILVVVGFFIIGLSWSPIASILSGHAAWFIQVVISWLANRFSSFPYSSISISHIGLYEITVYFLLITTVLFLLQQSFRARGVLLCVVIANILIWKNVFSVPSADIIFMDVGQGDAALIRFSNGKTMLVDAGNRNRWEDYGARVVLPVLNYFDIKQLNWTVMSHPHADHIGGLVSVVEEIHTDTLWDSYADYDSWTYNHLLDRYSNAGTEIIIPNSGDILVISPLESIHILAPDSSFVKQSHNINNASIVFKLTVGETSLLFTGDIEKEGDERLLNFGEYLKTDVLKVAHHGSITSTSNALLKFISPVIAVVSVGEGNKFSHPSAGVMDRFSSQGITIHRTDHKGALWLQMDGHNIWEKNWK